MTTKQLTAAQAHKQDTKFMLWYCRKYIPGFAEMHDRAKASKLVASKGKPK